MRCQTSYSRCVSRRMGLEDERAERLKDLLHRSPHDFGKERSTWTLELAARVNFEQGIISTQVSDSDATSGATAGTGDVVGRLRAGSAEGPSAKFAR